MKKCLFFSLAVLCIGSQIHAWDWFEKKIVKPVEKRVIKPIERRVIRPVAQVFRNPAKMAADAGKDALKTVGINLNGIIKNVNDVKSSVGVIQSDISSLQSAINASNSPVKKGPIIANKVADFQKKAADAQKSIGVADMKSALSNMAALGNILKNLADNTMQTQLRNLYNAYNGVITEIDSVEIRSILQKARKALLDMSGMLESCLKIRDYAGKLSKTLISNKLASAIRRTSSSLRLIAGDLLKIIQGGVRTMASAQSELAGNFISNMGNINKLIASIQQSTKIIPPKINAIKSEANKMNALQGKLIATAKGIPTRLEKLVLKKIKSVMGAFDVPRAARQELTKIIIELRRQINVLLHHASEVISDAAIIIQDGVNGIGAFKKYIKFDVVPPLSRVGVNALPGNVRGLSSAVEQLRRAIP